MKPSIVAPSILSANLINFGEDLELINKSPAEWIHIDVMDGSFVHPITFGDNIVKACRANSKKFLDVHLMIKNPQNHFDSFIKAGADGISFHLEACQNPLELLRILKAQKIQAGLAIKPETEWEDFASLIPETDLLLIMTVEPGYGGQKFIPEMVNKIQQSYELIARNNLKTKIQVDGGINEMTGRVCWEAGAESLVAGSYIFNQPDPIAQINTLLFK